VWAKLARFPWWPAECCEDNGTKGQSKPGAQLVQFFGANDYGFVLEKNLRPLADAPAQTLSAAASIALDKAQERVRQIQAPGGVIEAAV